jgi:lambda family phage portal protein
MNFVDRALLEVAPRWTLNRLKARVAAASMARYFEAAQPGRRTKGWRRTRGDANAVNGPAISILREHARDLERNNPWAKRGLQIIANNMVGWGIAATPVKGSAGARSLKNAKKVWESWAETTECDFYGLRDIYGLQKLASRAVARDGEVLIRRRRRPAREQLTIPIQLQVLEADFIDTLKDQQRTENGNRIIQGIEYDSEGRRVAYWLYEEHPGSVRAFGSGASLLGRSKRIAADDIIHVYEITRPGQVRGISWFAPVIVSLKDHDEYEDATLLRQKIAACFSAFVTDLEGGGASVGTEKSEDGMTEQLEPGMIVNLPIGKDIKFSEPPTVSEHDSFSNSVLRKIAAGLGVTVEDLTGNYQRMPFSAARMSRLSHWANVHDWQWMMLIPQMCDPVWRWAMEAAVIAGEIKEIPRAKHTPPRMPMIEPDKEGLAFMRLVRAGAMTFDEMVRLMGEDPDAHWEEYAENLTMLDEKGIILDSDARHTSQTGQLHPDGDEAETGGASGSGTSNSGDDADDDSDDA